MRELSELIVVGVSDPKPASRNFNSTACAVAMAFERQLNGLLACDCKRLCISCRQGISLRGVSTAGGCLELPVEFDFARYFDADDIGRKAIVADTIVGAVRRYQTETGLDPSHFASIRDGLAASGFDTHWYHREGKWNRPRTLHARVKIEHEVRSCRIVVEVRNAQGETVHAVTVASEDPHRGLFIPFVGQVRWTSAASLEYSAKALPTPVKISIPAS